jgi:1-deoxy-D-xylulose-5-phosphate synthase
VAAPRDGDQLRELFNEAVRVDDGPTMVRFPKGALPDPIAAVERTGAYDVLRRSGASDVLIVAVGPMALCALDVAERLKDQGIGVTVIDPRWVLPVPRSVAELAADFRLVVTIEDNLRVSGFGASAIEAMQDAEVSTPAHVVGLPPKFLDHAKRAQVLDEVGLTAQQIARDVVERVSGLTPISLPDAQASTRHNS